MVSWKLRLAVLAIAMSLLGGCGTGASDGAPCPPVVEYDAGFRARAAGELAQLPSGTAIEKMLTDYHVMRQQARTCN